ncbi:MAG: CDP-glucose 4,6-dehydratase [Crocinitomicaceae bacterium]|jgi:CDP-glucose 4,6-dehydratase|nr:CDP-glucose 4,6-dehydratase [Crocinitomicaceae bacterium]
MNFQTFKNKTVLITGHTGFKGSWLAIWLHSLGAKVVGVALDPPSVPSLFEVTNLHEIIEDFHLDIREGDDLKELVMQVNPDFVFHLAAQALVRQSYIDPVETYQTNVLGTINLLEAMRPIRKPCTAILITSDKSYENVDSIWGYRENDALGGSDPYSASKSAVELLIRSHVRSFFPKTGNTRIAVGRAGNVIGGGDWASDRIVPDCVRSWEKGEIVNIRNPHSIRPWQHVLESLSGYLLLSIKLSQLRELHGEPFNFGPQNLRKYSVIQLVQSMSLYWDQVSWEDDSKDEKQPYEAASLKLNSDKAYHYLNWQTVLNFKETVKFTADWYKNYYTDPQNILKYTTNQIEEYTLIAKNMDISK